MMDSAEHSPTSSNHSTSEVSEEDAAFFLDSDLAVPYSSSPATSSPACVATPPDVASETNLEAPYTSNTLPCEEEEHFGSDRISQVQNAGSLVDNHYVARTITIGSHKIAQKGAYSDSFDSSRGSGTALSSGLSEDAAQVAFANELDALLLDVLKEQDSSGSTFPLAPLSLQAVDPALGVSPRTGVGIRPSEPCIHSGISSDGTSVSLRSSVNVFEQLVLRSGHSTSNSSSLCRDNGISSPDRSSAALALSSGGGVGQDTLSLDIPSGVPVQPSALDGIRDSIHSTNVPLRTPSITTPSRVVPLAPKKAHRPGTYQRSTTSGAENVTPRPIKKRKISHFRSTRSQNSESVTGTHFGAPAASNKSRRYASRPASLRKAASLRSEPSPGRSHKQMISSWLEGIQEDAKVGFTTVKLEDSESNNGLAIGKLTDQAQDFPPTQPVTPLLAPASAAASLVISPLPSPLPIIAPPPFVLVPRAPLTDEDVAEGRIVMMLTKEQMERLADALPVFRDLQGHDEHGQGNDGVTRDMDTDDELSSDDHDMEEKEETVDGIREGSPVGATPEDTAEDKATEELAGDTGARGDSLDITICIQEDFRREVVEWILGLHSRPLKKSTSPQLHEQLTSVPDTRWHAAQLFTRYFTRLGTPLSSATPGEAGKNACERSKVIFDDSEAAFVWDVAVSCIALSVKFHRDVLSPFYPVLAEEFLEFAPHEISYEDLESAQREILSTFSFCIGSITPGAYIQELWLTLPSLRRLLAQKGEWEAAQRAAWETLSDALLDVEYLRYPISLLAGCALVVGSVDTLVLRAKINSASTLIHRSDRWRPREIAKCDCAKQRQVAQRMVRGVEVDIRELLGASEECWELCKEWLVSLFE